MMPEPPDVFSIHADMEPGEIVGQLDHTLRTLAGEGGYQGSVERFVPGAGEVFGVRVPQLRELAGEIFRQYQKSPGDLLAIARSCWERASREHRLVALFLLNRTRLRPEERWALGEEFLPDVGDWETCDQLCSALLGPALAQRPDFMDAVERWSVDANFWVRRAALVSTVSLRRSKLEAGIQRTLDRRTLQVCERLLDDPEAYIRKAVDWALRELIKRDYGLGQAFLFEQAIHKPGYPARATLKLAAKKLNKADQARFLELLGE
jgi:3-methyladenine DNA glycosylase AlkD